MSPDQAIADEIRRLEEQYARYPEGYAFARLADAHRKAGEPARALAILERGLGRHPRYLSAHIVRARSLRDLGRVDEAVEAFQAVLDLDPQNLVALRTLAEMARERGEMDEAMRWYRGLAELEPLDEGVREALEELRAGRGADGPGEPPERAPDLSESPERPGDGETTRDAQGAPEPAGEAEPAAAPESARREPPPGEDEPTGGQEPPDDERPMATTSQPGEEGEGPGEEGQEDLVVTATMGDLYMRQELYEEAVKVYERLLRRRPGDPVLLEKLDVARRLSAGRGGRVAARSAPLGGARTRGLPREVEAGPTIRDYLVGLVEGDASLPEGEGQPGGSRFVRWLGRDAGQE